jgi:hypothetical protein
VHLAATFFGVALLTLAWLRGPGSRPHDPPVAHDRVRWFTGTLALGGGFWLVRAIAGLGGFFLVDAALLVVSLAGVARAHARRS